MRTKPTNFHRHFLLFTSLLWGGCGIFGDDGERYEKLDRLRVLAIQSDPPALGPSETATLRANVYEPRGSELAYAWSWCPSRADESAAFGCDVAEEDWGRAWAAAGFDQAPPPYDLGTEREAAFTQPLSIELVSAICDAAGIDERLAAACFEGLEPSIQLTVRSAREELTAIKSIPLLLGEAADAERNVNPPSDFAIALRDADSNAVVESDQPLRAGRRYTAVAEVDAAAAETFTPTLRPGEPTPEARRETLVMTWFVTVGELVDPDDEDGFGDDFSRTTFVDGSNDITDLLRNGWKLPLTAGPSAALHLVLRDERGGVGWATRHFDVVGGEP